MLKKLKNKVWDFINSTPGLSAQLIVTFIWVILTAIVWIIISILGNIVFLISFIVLTILVILWLLWKDHLLRYSKILLISFVIISIGFLLWIIGSYAWSKYSSPAIFNLTKWFEIVFEDAFEWWNLSNNPSFIWWNKDDKMTNSEDKKVTLKSSSAAHQVYPIFQNLKNLNRDHILLTKFYLPDGARISTQFMNTQGIDSDIYLDYHLQECILSSYKWVYNWENYSKWYWEYIYERRPVAWGSFNKTEVTPGIYYMLVSVSSNKFSCYIQKEWENDYLTVINNKELRYTNLGWPTLSRMIDGSAYLPKILDFKLYARK